MRVRLPAIALLFIVSGAAGLVDQVCFSKYLSYIVGSTAHAVSAVLAAFMAGMALGARLGGSFASRVRRPLFAYGVLELLVGLAVVATPYAFSALTPVYVSLYRSAPGSIALVSAVRWLLAVVVVIVPTTAMGATLPLLARLTEGASTAAARERMLAVLYAANTLGGAGGSLACAYIILPEYGLRHAMLLAAGASATVGLIATALGWQSEPTHFRDPTPVAAATVSGASDDPRPMWVLDLAAFSSGALVFACEVLFVHLLALLVGNSAYAFGVILSIFLICLFLGAALAPTLHRALGAGALPLAFAGAAIALALSSPAWSALPNFFIGTGDLYRTFQSREFVRGMAALTVLFVPTTLMGLSFPLLLQSAAARSDVGRVVGRLTSVNTVGSVLGSLLVGYYVLPKLGSQRSLAAIASMFAVVAVVLAWRWGGTRVGPLLARTLAATLGLLAAGAGWAAPRWDLVRLTGGYNVYFDTGRGDETILYLREDTEGGVTSVTQSVEGVRTLLTNGKFQGNDSWEMHAQQFFAHYPSIFVRKFDRALVVGVGTGTTLGTLTGYPYKNVDVVEISPAIVEASKLYFNDLGGFAFSDPRVTASIADGRNFLLVNDKSYDLISMELSSIWFAGSGSLYSREFYRLAHSRLAQGGVLQQWIQLHHIRPRDLATVLHTIRLEFQHVLFFYGGGQGIILASEAPLTTSGTHVSELESALPEARRPLNRRLVNLLDDVLLTTREVDAFIADVANETGFTQDELISTDDNLYLEYATPKGNILPWSSREDLVARLVTYKKPGDIFELLSDTPKR
ncbi:MAG: spermidine synthase [Polyangiaceae bacterium]